MVMGIIRTCAYGLELVQSPEHNFFLEHTARVDGPIKQSQSIVSVSVFFLDRNITIIYNTTPLIPVF